MRILGISGSTRKCSTSTALLNRLCVVAPQPISIKVYQGVQLLPIFSPDQEGSNLPQVVAEFCQQIGRADAVLIASPEYVRALPGGLKNAIDWLVSRDEIMHKPVALVHASHRGDDMLNSLRIVLSTVSTCFDDSSFLRIPLMSLTPNEVNVALSSPDHCSAMQTFLLQFSEYVRASI